MRQAPPDPGTIDPASASEVERVGVFLDRVPRLGPEHEVFLRRLLDESPDELVRGRASAGLATIAQASGNRSLAETLYRKALPAIWGSNSRCEQNACINYGLLCLGDRRLLESLFLSRHAHDVSVERGNEYAIALSLLYISGVLVEVGDWPTAAEYIGRVAALAPRLELENRAYLDNGAAGFSLLAAYVRDDATAAKRHHDRLLELGNPVDPRAPAVHRAYERYTARDLDAVLESVRAALEVGAPEDSTTCELLLLEVRCLAEIGDRDTDAFEAALDLLRRLSGPCGDAVAAGRRLGLAQKLGRILLRLPAGRGPATRAFDVAGSAALERISEADRFRREFPQFGRLRDGDRRIFDRYRERFLRDHSELLDAVAQMLTTGTLDPARLELGRAADQHQLCVCAWCHRLRGPDGLWMALGDVSQPVGPVDLSHGICEPCHAEAMSNITAEVAAMEGTCGS